MKLSILLASTAIWLQTSGQSVTLTGSLINSGTTLSIGPDFQTSRASYNSGGSTITLSTATATSAPNGTFTSMATSIASANTTRALNTTSSASRTTLSGTVHSTTSLNTTVSRNTTHSATSTAAQPSNTVPCNGYPQFCSRKFSNITMVAAHNSPFVQQNNIASNQMLDVTTQLNDGVRMLQFQAHLVNGTLYLCHTSCSLLNAGTLVDYFKTVVQWLERNPYDVIAILIGNYDYVNPGNFTGPFSDSGLIDYVYYPPTAPMSLSQWPTLGQMILQNQRVVAMLDYQADQSKYPWLMDEFDQMWETPFSPTDRSFPCTVDRPPNQDQATSRDRMFLTNHNLNVELNLGTMSLLVPATNILNETNAVSGYGSAGATVSNCTANWNRAPNFLLVDYYNIGNFNGSVFQVAATANGVTYNRASCCGTAQRSPAGRVKLGSTYLVGLVVAFLCLVWY